MKIALDFDGTYTSDETLWENFVAMAKERGHDVKIVTARSEENGHFNDDVHEAAKRMGIDIVFCNMCQKQDCYGADIWIDDRPDMVVGLDQINTMHEMFGKGSGRLF